MESVEDIQLHVATVHTESIFDILPHGSGFNYDWSIEKDTDWVNRKFCYYLYSTYQVMNENGFYCGSIDFKIGISCWDAKNWVDDFEIVQWSDNVDDDEVDIDSLHQYIEETITNCFQNIHSISSVKFFNESDNDD